MTGRPLHKRISRHDVHTLRGLVYVEVVQAEAALKRLHLLLDEIDRVLGVESDPRWAGTGNTR